MTLLMPCIACFDRRLMAVAGPRILGPAACHDAQRREQRAPAGHFGPGVPAEAADSAGFLLAAGIIPVGDAIIVLRGNGPKATVYGVHAATAAVMLAAAAFLFV